MRLSLDDIQFKTEGQQIKEAILKYYNCPEDANVRKQAQFLDRFAREANICYDYTFRRSLGVKKFEYGTAPKKLRIVTFLGCDYYDIAKPKEKQIEGFVGSVCDNIKEYSYEKDIEVIEKLLDLCGAFNLKREKACMYWAKAMYYINRDACKDITAAIELLKIAIKDMEILQEHSKATEFMIDLEYAYLLNAMHIKYNEICSKIESRIENHKISDQYLFLHYYRTGIMYLDAGVNEKAIEYFFIAADKALSNYDKANTLCNIGVTKKRMQLYDSAISYQQLAMETYDSGDYLSRYRIYNNMAEIYKCKGELKVAYNYAILALNSKAYSKRLYFICIHTYVEIMLLLGENNIIMNELLDKIKEYQDHKQFMYEALKTVVKYGKCDTEIKRRTKDIIIKQISDNANEPEHVDRLKILLADLLIVQSEEVIK